MSVSFSYFSFCFRQSLASFFPGNMGAGWGQLRVRNLLAVRIPKVAGTVYMHCLGGLMCLRSTFSFPHHF